MSAKLTKLCEQARHYLGSEDARNDTGLCRALSGVEDAWREVIDALFFQLPPHLGETGCMKDRRFRTPRLQERHPDATMVLEVPERYRPSEPAGLIIWLHGGGKGQPRDTPSIHWSKPGFDVQDLFRASGHIVCLPVSPPDEESYAAWNHPQVDAYIADVIEELEQYYAIDPQRVYLGGNSMGGLGAMHLVQRMPDRFASIMAQAGSWDLGFWPVIDGTDFWMAHGINDAVFERRRHGTDIGFARLLHQRLNELGIAHTYHEGPGGHGLFDNRHSLRAWLAHLPGVKRDPHYPHVTAVSPRGCTRWQDWRRHPVSPALKTPSAHFSELAPSPSMRWVDVGEPLEDTLCFDQAITTACSDWAEDDWDAFEVRLKRKQVRAAMVEARRVNRHTLEVCARNTASATLWLDPSVVDANKLEVIVHGHRYPSSNLRPTLKNALDAYLRRRDRGMIYPIRVDLEADKWWRTRNQIS